MAPDLSTILHALHRSRTRAALLLELDARKTAMLSPLSRATGVRSEKARAALHGRDGSYRADHSLVAMDLVRVRATELGQVYEITDLGEQIAGLLARELRAAGGQRVRWTRTTIAF